MRKGEAQGANAAQMVTAVALGGLLALGVELPKILRGWQRFRLPVKHRVRSRYDAVGMVGTPIEHCVHA